MADLSPKDLDRVIVEWRQATDAEGTLGDLMRRAIAADRALNASQAAPPAIDYQALIEAAMKRVRGAQGTPRCVAFKAGAEWYREQVLAAAPNPPTSAQVPDAGRGSLMGRRQREILEAVRAEARSWLEDDEIAHLAADACVTTLRLYVKLAGSTVSEINRSASALVSRGLLRRVNVGWALSHAEYANVAAEAARAAPVAPAEPLTWHPAAGPKLPDADAQCLLWIRYSDGTEDWEAGWLDGDGWRLCESGGLVDGEVLFWAMPGGPRA